VPVPASFFQIVRRRCGASLASGASSPIHLSPAFRWFGWSCVASRLLSWEKTRCAVRDFEQAGKSDRTCGLFRSCVMSNRPERATALLAAAGEYDAEVHALPLREQRPDPILLHRHRQIPIRDSWMPPNHPARRTAAPLSGPAQSKP
jgi:hypothetical protein